MSVGGRYVSLFLMATGYVGSSMTWCGLVTVFQDHLASGQLALASSMALGILGTCKSNDGLWTADIHILNIHSCYTGSVPSLGR